MNDLLNIMTSETETERCRIGSTPDAPSKYLTMYRLDLTTAGISRQYRVFDSLTSVVTDPNLLDEIGIAIDGEKLDLPRTFSGRLGFFFGSKFITGADQFFCHAFRWHMLGLHGSNAKNHDTESEGGVMLKAPDYVPTPLITAIMSSSPDICDAQHSAIYLDRGVWLSKFGPNGLAATTLSILHEVYDAPYLFVDRQDPREWAYVSKKWEF